MKRSSRTPAQLAESTHQRLNMYALAASAAGVGMLALAQSAESKVIYTPADVKIGYRANFTFPIDLNKDGVTDFTLGYHDTIFTSGNDRSIFVKGHSGNEIEGSLGPLRFLASALKPGARISNRHRSKARARMAYQCSAPDGCPFATTIRYSGNWFNVTNRYLGLKFRIHGKTHYGWARLSIHWDTVNFWFAGKLTGYAYETIPNKPIIAGRTHGSKDDPALSSDAGSPADLGPGASLTNPIPDIPQPASLGLLAMGSPALSIWRRRESVRATQ
jgi:hypothetical protein